MFLVLGLLGCIGNCPDGATLEVTDKRDRLTAEETSVVEDAYLRIRSYMQAEDVCLAGIRVRGGEESNLIGNTLLLAAEDPEPEGTVNWAMCLLMADVRGYNDGSLEWFGPDDLFETACRRGPPEVSWRDAVQAACDGEDELSSYEQFMADEVFPGAPTGRIDGDLTAALGEAVDVEGLSPPTHSGYTFVQSGEHFLLFLEPKDPVTDPARLLRINPRDGTWTVQWEGPWSDDYWSRLTGGSEGGALTYAADYDVGPTIVHIDVDGTPSVIQADAPLSSAIFSSPGVTADRLWLADSGWTGDPLTTVDLNTGAVEFVALPEVEQEGPDLMASVLSASSSQVVLELSDVAVDHSYDSISISGYGEILVRYDIASETWEELTRGVHLLTAGLHDDRYLIGSVFSDAGRAVAAYDLNTDALLISDDVCLNDLSVSYPSSAAGGTLYEVTHTGDDEDRVYSFMPLTLSFD